MFSELKDRVFYGWVVVAAFLVASTIFLGTRLSFGIFFKSIESEFDLTRAATSTIHSTHMLLGGVFAFLGGWALDKYGPRVIVFLMGLFTGLSLLLTSQTTSMWQLFITYSLLFAVGISATQAVLISTVSRWFDKKRGLALGIATSGGALGTIVMAPFSTYLISTFGWRTAYLIIGLITWLIVIPLSRLLKRDPYEIGALPDGVKADSGNRRLQKPENEQDTLQSADLSLLQALRTRSLWLLLFFWLFFSASTFLIFTHLVPHATDIGFSPGEAAGVFSLSGVTAVAGRVIMGSVSDRIGKKLTVILCALLQAGSTVWLIWVHDLWLFYLFALVYGFAYGGVAPGMTALISDAFGLRYIGSIMGVLSLGLGIGAAIGPAAGGFIFDVTHSYSLAFGLGAGVMLIDTLLISLVRRETSGNFEGSVEGK